MTVSDAKTLALGTVLYYQGEKYYVVAVRRTDGYIKISGSEAWIAPHHLSR